MARGGDIIEVTYNHPTLGSGILFPKSDEDSTYDLGGFRSSDEDSGTDGSGAMIDTMTRKRWSLECTLSWDMNQREDLEKLVELAGDPVLTEWTWENINGTVYKAVGKPVGDLKGNGKSAQFPLKIAGGGVAKKVVG
jgi:hypothetical protein